MRRRFFVDGVRNQQAEISGDDAKHLTRVLRVEPGQRYEISDNRHVYLAEVSSARKEQVVFEVIEKLPPPVEGPNITLLAALIKFDHFEWMIEKTTELGVTSIVPVIATRSEHGLEKAAHKRLDRWRKIALEASQQARRAHLPAIEEPVDLSQAVERAATRRLALDEAGGTPLALAARGGAETSALLVGPEGGWTDREREAFVRARWMSVSLGINILRAETAAISALAVVQAEWLAKLEH